MSDADLLAFGEQMRQLVYPLRYGPDGKPSVSAFSIQSGGSAGGVVGTAVS
jgi:hypothetical protein